MKFNEKQLQSIINDKASQWGVSEKVLQNALTTIAEFDKVKNAKKVEQIYTKCVLKKYLREVHSEDRKKFTQTGDKKHLKNVFEVFPIGREGRKDISELMTWSAAFKDKRVVWKDIAYRQETGAKRAKHASTTMLAFAALAKAKIKK